MESPFWLQWWWPGSSCVKKWHRTLHIPCTNVNFLGSILSYNYVRYNYLEDQGKGYRGSFYTIFATSCDSNYFKIQTNQTKVGRKVGRAEVQLQNRPRDSLSWPHRKLRARWPFIIVSPWGWDDHHPNKDHSLNAGDGLALGRGSSLLLKQSLKGAENRKCGLKAPPASRTIGPSLKGSGQHTIVAPTASSCTVTNINSASRHRVWPFAVCYLRLCLSSLH